MKDKYEKSVGVRDVYDIKGNTIGVTTLIEVNNNGKKEYYANNINGILLPVYFIRGRWTHISPEDKKNIMENIEFKNNFYSKMINENSENENIVGGVMEAMRCTIKNFKGLPDAYEKLKNILKKYEK